MSFLIGLAAQVLEWIISKVLATISKNRAQAALDQKAKDEAQQSVDALKNAKTGEEIDKATDSTLSGL
jgi:hypothetical protein